MKKSILFVLFAMISIAGFSQFKGWNARVGMNVSNYTGDWDMNAKVGFKVGAGVEYGFNDTWSLQPSLNFTGKGAKKDGTTINAYYLELPIMAAARFNVSGNTNIVVNAGPYLACGVAGKTKYESDIVGSDSDKKGSFTDNGMDLKRFDMGLGVGVYAEFGKIIAGIEGQFGFLNVKKNVSGKNLNFGLSVGYRFW